MADDILERLHRLEAIEAIRQLKSRYWAGVDALDFDAVRACFADDALIEMDGVPPCDGPDAYVEFVRRANAAADMPSLHSGQNPRIRLLGHDRAEGIWDQLFVSLALPADGASRREYRLTGVYHDVYRLAGEDWRIAEMRFRQTSFLMTRVAADGALAVEAAGRSSGDAFGE